MERFSKKKSRKAVKKAVAKVSLAPPFPLGGMVDSLEEQTKATMQVLGIVPGRYEPPAKWELTLQRLIARGHEADLIADVAAYYRRTAGDELVRRQSAAGFEIGFERLLQAMTDQQIAEMRAESERKSA